MVESLATELGSVPGGVPREPWADPWRTGLGADAPFLRAWSLNALVHLASVDSTLASEARAALEAAPSDPKASVRARARRIVEES